MHSFTLAAAMDGSKVLGIGNSLFVCLLGVSIVFVGLICIILICKLMSVLIAGAQKAAKSDVESVPDTAALPEKTASVDIPVEKRGEFIAAVSAAIADDLGTDVEGIRITSVKKL